MGKRQDGRTSYLLQTEFCSSDPGTPRSYPVIQYGYHIDGPESIHQRQYIQKMLFILGMEIYQPSPDR